MIGPKSADGLFLRSVKPRCLAACVVVLLSLAAACIPATPPPTEPPSTSTPAPSPTPTAQPPFVLLIRPEGAGRITDELAQSVEQLAEQGGLAFVTAAELTPDRISPSARRIVIGDDAPGLPSVLADLAGAQAFIVRSGQIDRLQTGEPTPASEFELRRAFSAGYATSLLAPEWRIAAVVPADLPDVGEAFRQGGVFGCGLCNPPYPPYAEYPLVAVSQSEAETLSALEALAAQDVTVIYLGPGLATQASAQAASQLGMLVVGADFPPEAGSDSWAASIRPDLPAALRIAWEMDPQATEPVVAPLRLESTNSDLFSPGRQDDLRRLFDQLETGAVRILLDS